VGVCCFFGVTGVTSVTTLFYKGFFGSPKEKIRVTGVTKTDGRLVAPPVFIRLCNFSATGLVNQGKEIVYFSSVFSY
jgi:hypothetical protein